MSLREELIKELAPEEKCDCDNGKEWMQENETCRRCKGTGMRITEFGNSLIDFLEKHTDIKRKDKE